MDSTIKCFSQVILTVTLACYVFFIVKLILLLVNFHKIDKSTLEREEIKNFDEIANNDSDIEKNMPKYFSITSLNVLLAAFGTSYFVFNLFLKSAWLVFASAFFAVLVFIMYSFLKKFLKKIKIF